MTVSPREVAEAYWRAEERRDLAGVLGYYAEDAELVVPTMGRLVGHSQIRRFYEDSIERFPKLSVTLVSGVSDGATGAFEWSSVHRDAAGHDYASQGVNVLEVRDARFTSVHVYYDPTVFGTDGDR